MLVLLATLFVSVTSQIDFGNDCTPDRKYRMVGGLKAYCTKLIKEYYAFNNKDAADQCTGNKPYNTIIKNWLRFAGSKRDNIKPACPAWHAKWKLNPAQVWAVQQYTNRGDFCYECRKTWRNANNCQDTPKYFAYQIFTATHKSHQDELWKNKDLILYSGMKYVKMPESAKIGQKITLDENKIFWGPLSSTHNPQKAKEFATPLGMEGGHGIVLMITIPAGISHKQYGNFGALDISDCTGDGTWYLSRHVGEDEVILYDLPATWVTYYQTIYIKPGMEDEEQVLQHSKPVSQKAQNMYDFVFILVVPSIR